jgi:hypothetical protein
MKNRLYKSLFAVAISMSCVFGFASAPVIRDLPLVNIGDNENNIGTDNNFFVFTNAFKLDDYISQSGGSPIASLIWSFDEFSGPPPGNDAVTHWFQINGQDSILVGTAAVNAEALGGFTNHKTPTNMRTSTGMASFRDVVLSPVASDPPFHPLSGDLTEHALGKNVRFYASNGTDVGFKDTKVQSVDGTNDSLSGGSTFFVVAQDDTFTTGDPSTGTPATWLFTTGLATKYYSAGNAAIGVTVAAASNQFRQGGWQNNSQDWLKYSAVGSESVVRAKYYMFASPTTAGNKNQIPSIRLRVQERFAVTNALVVSGTNVASGVAINNTTQELMPSEDPTKPSLYRVDFVPICTPFLISGPFEGFQRYWDVYGDNAVFSGTIAMTESVIGTYPKALIDPSLVLPDKTYVGTDFHTYFPTDASQLVYIGGGATGTFPPAGPAPFPTTVDVDTPTAGAELDSSNVGASPRIGVPVREFNPPQDSGSPAAIATLVRADENKQYVVRWHLTSTKQTNRQSHVRIRSRSIGFGWSTQLEMSGAWVGNGGTDTSGGANNQLAQEAHPGIGSLNPDKIGTENGGWYTQVLSTPISLDIRPDKTGTWQQRMPNIALQPLPGSTSFGSADRAWRFGMDILDTLSNGLLKDLEEGNEFIDQLELRTYDLVPDN